MKPKLVIFCNTNSVFTSNILLNSFLKLHQENKISIIAVIETGTFNSDFTLKNRIKRIFSLVYNLKTVSIKTLKELSYSIKDLCKKNNINYYIPPGKDINSKGFLSELKIIKNFNQVSALVLGCPLIFKKKLIAEFHEVINYHDSYLPAYRGLNATAWSKYEGKKFSGYTFHLINEKIDDGKIIYQDLLSINQNWNIHQHLYNKTKHAVKSIDYIIKYLLEESFNNKNKENYFSDKKYYSEMYKQELIKSFYEIKKTDKNYFLQKRLIEDSFGIKL